MMIIPWSEVRDIQVYNGEVNQVCIIPVIIRSLGVVTKHRAAEMGGSDWRNP